MIFKVSKKVKSSLVLSSLPNALKPNAIVFIEENLLEAGDIQSAITRGILIPENKKEYEKQMEKIFQGDN